VAVLLALPLTIACGAASSQSPKATPAVMDVDEARAERVVEQALGGVDAALSRSDTDAAFEAAFELIAEDPAVAKAANDVFSRLGDDPRVARSAENVLGLLAEAPDFRVVLARYQAEHPADFETVLARDMDRRFADPDVDAAIDRAADELMERPRVKRAVDELSLRLLKGGEVQAGFTRAFVRSVERASKGRLADAVGVPESEPRFEKAYAAFLVEPARIDRLMVAFARVFAHHPAPRRAIVSVLSSAEFLSASAAPVAELFGDRDFSERSVRAIVAVLSGVQGAELQASARDVMTCPAAEAAMAGWLSALASVPAVRHGFVGALTEVAESPEVARAIEDVYFGGPPAGSAG